ncbi:hypothetical protein D8674_017706 [Pyrus ussuriensis x Pyrus communis]|uniref:RNase H type-1 domain-containing protein n=1 Tax=Pyrus ussuriensis x Pyrus communis TaxID=2448454 RepID=A0A5N5HDF7_9ROSA|nr:hypothetical protein D8674_017706 [Pyrus ussuriensis x Pyrus communis]
MERRRLRNMCCLLVLFPEWYGSVLRLVSGCPGIPHFCLRSGCLRCWNGGRWISKFFQTANSKPTRMGCLPTLRWSTPTHGWVKITTDGALNVIAKLGGVGVVRRDWRGGFLVVGEQQFPGITSVLILELFVVRYGLRMAQQHGFQQVMVESEFMKAIATLNRTHLDSSAIGMIADDVMQLVFTFSIVRFIHVSRLCNGVAQHLAKFALSSSNNLVWFEEPPTRIQELLFQDICNSS